MSYSNTATTGCAYRKSKLIIMWGANPAVSSNGSPTYNYLQAKKAGAKFIFVDPFYSASMRVLADEWIPIRPATDAAFLIGMAYVMITEDNPTTNPLLDWDFLNNGTVGFDAEHMPEAPTHKNNFKDYVLGTYDGVPKKPDWASAITGVPPRKSGLWPSNIATTRPTMVVCGGANTRTNNGPALRRLSSPWPA